MARKLPPIQPGDMLLEELMRPLGMSSNALAQVLGVTPARTNEIVRGRRGITADTALRLARLSAPTRRAGSICSLDTSWSA